MLNLENLQKTDRVNRNPKHTFVVTQASFAIQPFMLARVLPGESLKNLRFEARTRMTNALSPIIGFTQQYFFFYVRASDLALDYFRDMFVDEQNRGLAATQAVEEPGGRVQTYCAAGGIDWSYRALEMITKHYFRDQDEAWTIAMNSHGVPIAQIRESTWMDSLIREADLPEGAALSTATDAGDLDRLMDMFSQLRALGIANMTYEDWLRSNGINIPEKDENKPKLLTVFRDFKYPSNLVDSDGGPAFGYSNVVSDSFNKPCFFKEPGFLVGLSVIRPKTYFNNLKGSLAGFADRAWDWAPNYLREMPETTLKSFPAATGPITGATVPYVVDMRDDLIHGDQFIYDPNGVIVGEEILLPDLTSMKYKYPTSVQALAITGGSMFQTDGVCSLTISGFERDFSVGNFAQT